MGERADHKQRLLGVRRNELETPTFADGPFRAYRSIERTHTLPRATRYFRSLGTLALGKTSTLSSGGRVRINPECRSYHLGWFLYVWSDRLPLLDDIVAAQLVHPLPSRLAS